MSIKIYHNPRCKKSRAGLEYLKQKSSDFVIIEYLKNTLSFDELKTIFEKLKKKPEELIRTQDESFKTEHKHKNYSDDEWLNIIVKNPKLLQRPIVTVDENAILAIPVEEIDKIL